MLRRPAFWIVFVLLSVAAAIFTFRNFSTAFPLVSIDFRMDRAQALQSARMLAEKYGWPPMGFDAAAEFSGDQEVQNFIELEGGGKPELARILKNRIYAPYRWRVRLFKEGDAHETLVRFTPEGDPYGFRVQLPAEEKGASIPVKEAQQIAEDTARNEWKIDFTTYKLVESSQETRPGGRTDHTFVYERQDERVGEGRYRLRLVVGGDKLTELTPFVQVPEAFTRRYEQMRSANDAISVASSIALFGPYLLGFCGIGLFFMIRQHRVLWRQGTFWGLFIAFLVGLDRLNSWPLMWMNYDTAVPASRFAFQQLMTAFGIFGAFGILLTISFIAAETLSRRAFPQHVQLWKVWSRPVSSSRTIFGQTLAGYLLVAPFFAYEVVLYFFAQGKLGWWTPSDTLVNPDVFASYLPSLSAIAQAAQAGFWEESLFRAAPLATAAILGEKFGRRRLFIGVAMVLQALVFASGHAGYVNQPSYARVVELIIPSFVFGTIYLLFGLLPGIVLHFAYDTVWMALPLFVSTGARAHFEQAIVILAVLIPLWVVLVSRARSAKWTEVPDDALNGAWMPPREATSVPPEPAPAIETTSIRPYVMRWLPVAGLAGLIAWIAATPFHTDAPPIEISRGEAERMARDALGRRGERLDSSWEVLGRASSQPDQASRFVWQTAGRERYEKLLGTYLTPPSRLVRFARFQGDVAERAEEYEVRVYGRGGVFRLTHQLAEATPGKSLTQEEARALAVSAVPEVSNFNEVSAQAAKRPNRTDWTFIFKDNRDYGLTQGEARMSVDIAGDEISDSARYVYVPEEWARNERARRFVPTILGIACSIVIVAIIVAGAVVGAIHWSRKRPFSTRTFFAVMATVFTAGTVNMMNNLPVFAAQASTAQPLGLQIGIAIASSIVFGVFTGAGLALVAGLVAGDRRTHSNPPMRSAVVLAVSVGMAMAGISALIHLAAPRIAPVWGSLGPASAFAPFLGGALGPLGGFFTGTLILLVVVYGLQHRPRAAAIWILVGLAWEGTSSVETIPSWLIIGVTTGIVLWIAYRLVFRNRPEMVLLAAGTLTALSAIRDGMQRMYSGALPASVTAAIILAISALIWFRGTISKPKSGY